MSDDAIIKSVIASLNMEGLNPSDYAIDLVKRRLNGELNEKEVV